MFEIDRRLLQNFDWMLLLLVTAIVAAGIVNLASATHVGDELTENVRRQLFSLGIGGVALVLALVIDYRRFERLALPLFAICIALLAATFGYAGDRPSPQEAAKTHWAFQTVVRPEVPPRRKPRARISPAAQIRSPIRWKPNIE